MNCQNKTHDNSNLFFKPTAIAYPCLNISLLRAQQLNEIPLDHLDETVFVSDFDFTIKYPRFISNDNGLLSRNGAVLRGGLTTLTTMQQIKKNAWGYYIASAASPGKSTAEAMITEMKNIYIDEKHDISNLFINQPPEVNAVNTFNINLLWGQTQKLETFPRCYIYDNIILNNYDKAAGTIIKIKNTKGSDKKISKIVFVDDFVANAFFYPTDFINYLSNIRDKLADTVSIVSVWLDPTSELTNNNNLREIIFRGYENSFSESYGNFINYFSNQTDAYLSLADYENLISTMGNNPTLKI